MIEKEYPIFAFEERRNCGVSQEQTKNECSVLEAFLDKQEIERKSKNSVFNVFVENSMQQWRRGRISFYQVILYRNYILLELLIELHEYEDIDEFCFTIENCNKLFIKEGREGLKKMFRMIIKGKKYPEFLEEFRTSYNLDFILLVNRTKNPIQVEKIDKEQTLKITYKIDL